MDDTYPEAIRAADRTRVCELDTQIQELEHRLRALQAERESCLQRLEEYKYPVLTLPNELVSEIFVHALPPYPSCPPMTGPKLPISLTHICRKWREIALSTPTLWRTISLGPLADDKQADMIGSLGILYTLDSSG